MADTTTMNTNEAAENAAEEKEMQSDRNTDLEFIDDI